VSKGPKDKGVGQQHQGRALTGNMRKDAERYEGRIGIGTGPVPLQTMQGRGWQAQRGKVKGGQAEPGGDLRPEARGLPSEARRGKKP
jgi:hypothetical protein